MRPSPGSGPGFGPRPAGRRRPQQLWLRVGSVGFWSGPAGSDLVLMRLSCFDVRRSKVSGSGQLRTVQVRSLPVHVPDPVM